MRILCCQQVRKGTEEMIDEKNESDRAGGGEKVKDYAETEEILL